MSMNWLNIKYIGRAGLIIILLFFTCPSSATCKTDTVINTYKRDSLYFAVKADSIIAFHTGDSLFTIIKADTVLPVIPKAVKRTGYDNRVHRFRKNWERIIPTHAKIQYAGNMGLLSFGTGWDRKTESMGNRYIARIHPEIFVEKDKSDNDTETELYALEY